MLLFFFFLHTFQLNRFTYKTGTNDYNVYFKIIPTEIECHKNCIRRLRSTMYYFKNIEKYAIKFLNKDSFENTHIKLIRELI